MKKLLILTIISLLVISISLINSSIIFSINISYLIISIAFILPVLTFFYYFLTISNIQGSIEKIPIIIVILLLVYLTTTFLFVYFEGDGKLHIIQWQRPSFYFENTLNLTGFIVPIIITTFFNIKHVYKNYTYNILVLILILLLSLSLGSKMIFLLFLIFLTSSFFGHKGIIISSIMMLVLLILSINISTYSQNIYEILITILNSERVGRYLNFIDFISIYGIAVNGAPGLAQKVGNTMWVSFESMLVQLLLFSPIIFIPIICFFAFKATKNSIYLTFFLTLLITGSLVTPISLFMYLSLALLLKRLDNEKTYTVQNL
tara:strand:- start:6208 stop:7161 length:954 start_codon:yes stop_codon:yes gene_type:complete